MAEAGTRSTPPRIDLPGYEPVAVVRRSRVGWWLRARQVRIDRDVLIKVAPSATDATAAELAREVRVLGRMRHESLLTLIDYHADLQRPCAVYELPEGRSLVEEVAACGGTIGARRAAVLCAQVAELVEALDAAGLRLRRLAPDDLFLDANGRIRLTTLEGAHSGGGSADADPHWFAGDEEGTRCDVFLLGLLLFFLVTGKAPVARSVRQSPGRWLDMASRALAREATGRATLAVLRQLFDAAERGSDAARALEALRGLASGGASAPRAEPPPLGRRLARIGVAALFTVAVAAIGMAVLDGWRDDTEPSPNAGGSGPGREADTVGGAPGGSGGADAPGKTDSTAAGPTGDTKTVVVSEPGGTGGTSGTSADPSPPSEVVEPVPGAAPGTATEPGDTEPIELLVPEKPPSDIELFVTHVEFPRAEGGDDESPAAHWERLWSEGSALARGLVTAEGGGPSRSEMRAFADALLRVRTRLEELSLRESLFATNFEIDGDTASARYDFASRTQLRDWTPAGASSRVSIAGGRLVVHGEAHLRAGRFFRDRIACRLVVPAAGRHPQRPNVNVVLWSGKAADGVSQEVLFGLGTYFGDGLLRREGSDDILLPAFLVSRPRAGTGSDPATWPVLWAVESALPPVDDAVVTLEWNREAIVWLIGDLPVVPTADVAALATALAPLSGRSGTVALQSFGSTVEIEEIEIEGTIDRSLLAVEARRNATQLLERRFPGLFAR